MASTVATPTPLLRVSRPISACQRCRRAKVKCDGKLPACTACEKAGRSGGCSSANDNFARGKERSYVTSLETQVERLERRISQAKDHKASINMLEVASTAGISGSSMPCCVGSGRAEKQESNNIDDLVSDFGFLSVNATARDFHGFTGDMSFARMIVSASSLEPLPADQDFALPPRCEITPLIQHYLESIHVIYPFVSESSLYTSIDQVYGHSRLYATPTDHWMALMVVAVSHASQVRARGDPHYQETMKYNAAALKHVENVIRPGSTVGIQALLLMVLLSLWMLLSSDKVEMECFAEVCNAKVPHYYNSWYLIGVASRAAIDLGLHQDPPYELERKTANNTLRCRIFDCVYSLDRVISIVHQRPFSFSDESINVNTSNVDRSEIGQIPPLFSKSLQPAKDLLIFRRIQSKYYQELFQSSPLTISAAWPIMCAAVRAMAQWFSSSLNAIGQEFQSFYRCEILYTIVLMMTPLNWIRNLPKHCKFLVLQYAMEFAHSTKVAIGNMSLRAGLYTSYDLLRIIFVAKRFLTLLDSDGTLLLSSSLPSLQEATLNTVESSVSNASWPFISTSPFKSNDVNIPAHVIDHNMRLFESAIEYFSSIYGFTKPLQEYRTYSSNLRRKLAIEY